MNDLTTDTSHSNKAVIAPVWAALYDFYDVGVRTFLNEIIAR